MKSAVICGICALLGALVFTATYANPDRSQQLMDHLANLEAHARSPLVRKLLEAVMENTEDENVAVFVQDLLDQSLAQGMNDKPRGGPTNLGPAFGRKEAAAAFGTFQSLPEMAQAQFIFTIPLLLLLFCCIPLLCSCCLPMK